MLAGEGEDLRVLSLSIRKVGFAQMLRDPVILIAEYEQGARGS
jgi:hypothetical protein